MFDGTAASHRSVCRNLGMGCELQALPYSTVVQHPAVKVEHVYHWHVPWRDRADGGAQFLLAESTNPLVTIVTLW